MSRSSWQMFSGAAGLLAAFAAVSVFLLSSESLHVLGISVALAIVACLLVNFSLAPEGPQQTRRSHQHQTR